jgi:hypothetical protein
MNSYEKEQTDYLTSDVKELTFHKQEYTYENTEQLSLEETKQLGVLDVNRIKKRELS